MENDDSFPIRPDSAPGHIKCWDSAKHHARRETAFSFFRVKTLLHGRGADAMFIFAPGRFPTGRNAPFTAKSARYATGRFCSRRSFRRILAGQRITIHKAASATQLFRFSAFSCMINSSIRHLTRRGREASAAGSEGCLRPPPHRRAVRRGPPPPSDLGKENLL